MFHTIHPLNVCNPMIFSKFTRVVPPSSQSILEKFHHPKKKSCTYWQPLPFPSDCLIPMRPLINLLSVTVVLFFCTFHVNGIIQHVVICDWLLSLRVMFSRFIPVASISCSFLFIAKWDSIVWIYPILSIAQKFYWHMKLGSWVAVPT